MSLATLYHDAEEKLFTKKERKALARTHGAAPYVRMKVTGERELALAEAHGWTLGTGLSQGRGAGHQQYLVHKLRSELVLDFS